MIVGGGIRVVLRALTIQAEPIHLSAYVLATSFDARISGPMSFESRVYEACQASARVFVLNPHYKRANFYSQQLRGLALVREMFRRGTLERGSALVVIGGGVSGLTMAAAALTGKAMVTLVEKGHPFSRYREATHRELHPNVISWPFQPLRTVTDLPFLNWTCAPAPNVCEQIERQWERHFAEHARRIHAEAQGITEDDDGVFVACKGMKPVNGHVVIVAVGWTQERGLTEFRGPGYWTPPPFEGREEVVVSGSGDGGLIDGAYQVFGRRTVEASRVLAYLLDRKPLKETIAKAERAALTEWTAGRETGALRALQRFYATLSIEDVDAAQLCLLKRSEPICSRLVHRQETAYSPLASPANKALFAFLQNDPESAVSTSRGEVRQKAGGSVTEVEEVPAASIPRPLDPMRLLLRHGADAACASLLSDVQRAALAAADVDHLTEFVPDEHDHSFYSVHAAQPLAATPTHKTEMYLWEAKTQLDTLIHYLTASSGEAWLDTEDADHWVVRSTEDERKKLEPLFPIDMRGLKVKLGAEPNAVFQQV